MYRYFIVLIASVFGLASCSTGNQNHRLNELATEHIQVAVSDEEKKKKSEQKKKKYVKKYSQMLVWDVAFGSVCKYNLSLAPAVCLAGDIVGDLGIALYHNRNPEV